MPLSPAGPYRCSRKEVGRLCRLAPRSLRDRPIRPDPALSLRREPGYPDRDLAGSRACPSRPAPPYGEPSWTSPSLCAYGVRAHALRTPAPPRGLAEPSLGSFSGSERRRRRGLGDGRVGSGKRVTVPHDGRPPSLPKRTHFALVRVIALPPTVAWARSISRRGPSPKPDLDDRSAPGGARQGPCTAPARCRFRSQIGRNRPFGSDFSGNGPSPSTMSIAGDRRVADSGPGRPGELGVA